MKDLLKEYVDGFICTMVNQKSPFADFAKGPPSEVLCPLSAQHRDDFECQVCAGTNRCPIPMAEVMNVR